MRATRPKPLVPAARPRWSYSITRILSDGTVLKAWNSRSSSAFSPDWDCFAALARLVSTNYAKPRTESVMIEHFYGNEDKPRISTGWINVKETEKSRSNRIINRTEVA